MSRESSGRRGLLSSCCAGIALVGAAGCLDNGERFPVQSSGQGYVTLRKKEVEPIRPAIREKIVEVRVPATGPTTRESELQQRIDSLEQQSKAMQAEIERLRREKAGK